MARRVPSKRRHWRLRRNYALAGRTFADLFTVAGSLRPGKPITFRRQGGQYRVDVGNDQGPWAESLYVAIVGWMAPGSLPNDEGRRVVERRRQLGYT